jgi:hypothetical protein
VWEHSKLSRFQNTVLHGRACPGLPMRAKQRLGSNSAKQCRRSLIPRKSRSVCALSPYVPHSLSCAFVCVFYFVCDQASRVSCLLNPLYAMTTCASCHNITVKLRCVGGEAAGASSLAPKVGPLGLVGHLNSVPFLLLFFYYILFILFYLFGCGVSRDLP